MRNMRRFGLARLTILAVVAVSLSACSAAGAGGGNNDQPRKPSAYVRHLTQTNGVGQIVSTNPPDAKWKEGGISFTYSHNGTDYDFNFASASTEINETPPIDSYYLAVWFINESSTGDSYSGDGSGELDNLSIDITFIYQADGTEYEISNSTTVYNAFGYGTDGTIDLPHGIDFWDADGNGEFNPTLDPDSDYSLFAFKQVSIAGTVVWSNPNL